MNVTPPNMNIPKNDIQSEAPRYNLNKLHKNITHANKKISPPNTKKTPPINKNTSTSQKHYSPFL